MRACRFTSIPKETPGISAAAPHMVWYGAASRNVGTIDRSRNNDRAGRYRNGLNAHRRTRPIRRGNYHTAGGTIPMPAGAGSSRKNQSKDAHAQTEHCSSHDNLQFEGCCRPCRKQWAGSFPRPFPRQAGKPLPRADRQPQAERGVSRAALPNRVNSESQQFAADHLGTRRLVQ